ncbi:MAG: hypothetical protein COV59_05015 [Candidatus Magasanikbacteria bacterium CG11_big_fil_rev_8_21_14_0_20_39_34]|uniref:Glutamine amidotransferase domain-containing protein n=1 Tax=Candidatus Magasanikbacteria bacterium CG11_big_fil_rev_8_21_14_0_20_39_34 TaxID=1974653 RepID=A0A2H0N3P5_9BACT|nr:MAG: hypothetical protein COV59_05015 [Candidatus Magasanikbacteria bacterium CG11_big_fil_rev_8_21_14_0_20_39_34]
MKKILIVQFRTDATWEHEQSCFHQDFEDLWEQFEFVDAVRDTEKLEKIGNSLKLGTSYAGIIFGGSSEFNYTKGDAEKDWCKKTFDFIQKILESKTPLLGICFGFQTIALQQGAKIVDDLTMREAGTYVSYVTDIGQNDPIFKNIPQKFLAQFGHKDTIINFPEQFEKLGYSERVMCNAFRIKGENVWGVLFHPELNPDRMRFRLQFSPSYVDGMEVDNVFENLEESPYALDVLKNFIEYCL